jgi:uncharacterized protein YggE
VNKTYTTSGARIGALTAFTAVFLACGAATAAAQERHPTISVVGEGSATATPNTAVVSVGVEVTRPSASAASADLATTAQAVLDAVHAKGVADKDVITQGLGLNPVYVYSDGAPKLTGYSASESFAITVRDIHAVGAVVQAATAAAGNAGRVSGISFGLADHTPLLAQARGFAIADAYLKAKQYADMSGHQLGDVVSLSEGGQSAGGPIGAVPPPMAPPGSGAPPIATGQVKDEVSVAAVYDLGPKVEVPPRQ